MARFVVRRVVQMLIVMFAVSVLTFVIFNVLPGGDPALRLAGRQPDPGQLERIREEWGFNDPVYVQYVKTMSQVFSGDLISYTTQQNVWDELKGRIPRTFALAIGAAIMWMVFATALGLYTAVKAGKFADRSLTILALIGHIDAGLLDRRPDELLPGLQMGDLPQRRIRAVLRRPVAVVLPPDHALDGALAAVHRRLLAHTALQRPRHDQRGLRAHRPGQGAARSARCCSSTCCATR